MAVETVSGVYVAEARYAVHAPGVPAGNWVLLSGIDATIAKSATVCDTALPVADTYVLRPIVHMTESVLHVARVPGRAVEVP